MAKQPKLFTGVWPGQTLGDNLAIRQAQRQDAKILAQAEAVVARSPGFLVQMPGEIPSSAYVSKIASLKQGGRYVVAELEGQIIGHAFLEPMGLQARRHVMILTIVVHDGFQGRGVGKALMRDLLGWAEKQIRVRKIELRVRAANERAMALYKKFGFVLEGRFRGRIKIADGDYVDDIAMAWFPKRVRRPKIG